MLGTKGLSGDGVAGAKVSFPEPKICENLLCKLTKNNVIFKKEFELWYPEWVNNACPRSHGLLKENLSAGCKIKLLPQSLPSQTMQTVVIVIFLNKKLCVCTYTSVHACHICLGASGGQGRTLDPRELEPSVIVSCLEWVLGNELRFSKSGKNC